MLSEFRFGVAHELGDGLQGLEVVALRGEYAAAQEFLAAVVDGDDFDLGAAEVNS